MLDNDDDDGGRDGEFCSEMVDTEVRSKVYRCFVQSQAKFEDSFSMYLPLPSRASNLSTDY